MFEQSGTFKREFRKLGMDAIDLDILNDFGETDRQLDLFAEIEKGYAGEPSIFDEITPDDLIMAFFPCTRFTEKVPLLLRTQLAQMQGWGTEKRLEYSRKIMSEVNDYYQTVCKLWITAVRGGQRMIMENPANSAWSLSVYFPIKAAVVHKDRSLYGDYMRKATQYWFLNCEPKNNFFLEDLQAESIETLDRVKGANRQILRSMISPTYANRFIREYIMEVDDDYGHNHEAERKD